MKKALRIVAIVALYSLLATIFLLSIVVVPYVGWFPPPYQLFVVWSQLVVIPGMAALFSRLMYGDQGWRTRAIKIILAGSVGLALFLTIFFFVGAAIAWGASVNWALFALLLVILGGGFVLGTVRIARKIHHRSVPLDTEKWLEDRRRNVTPDERKWRSRGIRFALWIPSLTALLVGTFLVPIWGLLSHAIQPPVGNLTRYRVPVPMTSVVLASDREPTNGYVWANGLMGQGSPLFGIFYPRMGLRLSYWAFRIRIPNGASQEPNNIWTPKDEEVTGKRQFTIGDESINCLEYLPSHLRRLDAHDYSSTVFVTCERSGRFSASFGGEKTTLPTFYQMLGGSRQIK